MVKKCIGFYKGLYLQGYHVEKFISQYAVNIVKACYAATLHVMGVWDVKEMFHMENRKNICVLGCLFVHDFTI